MSPHGRSSPDSLQILLNIASRLPGVISEKEESPTLESTSLCVAMSVYKCHYPPELVDIAFHSGWIIQYRPPRNRGILQHSNMGCNSSRIAGDTSVGTDNNQDIPAKPLESMRKVGSQNNTAALQAQHSTDSIPSTEMKTPNKKKVSAFIGTPDQYWKNRGASAAGAPISAI